MRLPFRVSHTCEIYKKKKTCRAEHCSHSRCVGGSVLPRPVLSNVITVSAGEKNVPEASPSWIRVTLECLGSTERTAIQGGSGMMDAAWEAEAKLSLHVERRFLEWNSQCRAVADYKLPFVQCNYVFFPPALADEGYECCEIFQLCQIKEKLCEHSWAGT